MNFECLMFFRRNTVLKDPPAKDFQSRAYAAGDVQVTIHCPQCGISRSGSAEQVLQWRAEHECPASERSTRILRFRSQFPSKPGRN